MFYYQFHIGDYVKATRHLTNLEDLAYRRLIDLYYDTELPLINDVKKLARLINMRENVEEVETVLGDFFELKDGAFTQNRINHEISEYREKADIARANGKKGGRPKKTQKVIDSNPEETEQEPKKTQSVILDNPEETGSKANPLTHKPTNPETNLKPSCDVAIATPEKKKKFNDDDVRFSEWFYQGLLNNNPDHKKPNFESNGWADAVRLMRERDFRTYDQMAELAKWTLSDSFWKANVLSPAKLREKWDQLTVKMKQPKPLPSSQKWDNTENLTDQFSDMFIEGEIYNEQH